MFFVVNDAAIVEVYAGFAVGVAVDVGRAGARSLALALGIKKNLM
jgi:hypothetical protein